MSNTLCPICAAESLRWLDYTCPPPIRIHMVGADDRHNVRQGIRTVETIRQQRALIAAHCSRTHRLVSHEEQT